MHLKLAEASFFVHFIKINIGLSVVMTKLYALAKIH